MTVGIPQFAVSAFLAVVSGIAVAVLTHYLASRRECAARKARLVGWLRWLSSFLDQAEKGSIETKGKLHGGQTIHYKLPVTLFSC